MWKNQEKRKLVQIPADEIRPNRAQPRHTFDEDGLRSLAESIKQNGLLQPVCVRKVVGGYELIAGERRLRACRMAGMKAIPCLVSGCDARQSAVLALLENLQRRDLNLFEEAEGLRRLDDTGLYRWESSCTLVCAARHRDGRLLVLHVGDGFAFSGQEVLSHPENGRFA